MRPILADPDKFSFQPLDKVLPGMRAAVAADVSFAEIKTLEVADGEEVFSGPATQAHAFWAWS